MENRSPFLPEETKIMDHLKEAYNSFVKLDSTCPSHKEEFASAINKCQDVIVHRIVQRDYPDIFPTFKGE